jgi:DNA-nicking Smr family endonuclease
MTHEPKTPEEGPADDEGLSDAYVVTTELDLHGFFPEQVPSMLEDFLQNAREMGYPQVKIIHGKGRSTMKRVVLECLEGHPLVDSFRDAWDSHSRWGATVAKIKTKNGKRKAEG